MVRRAAGDDDDAAEVADLLLAQAERLEDDLVAAHAVADRLLHRLGLLVDLLQHERLEAALLGALEVPVDLLRGRRLDHLAVDEDADAARRDLDHLAVGRMDDRARLVEERGDRRGEEVLPLAEADDERRLVADADEQVGMVVVDRDDREVALEQRIDAREGLREIAVVLLFEEMDDDFGVGLGGESVAAAGQLLAQLHVVLDDPVEDDREAGGVAADERVRVALGDAAVRRPARVAEAVMRVRAVRAGRGDEARRGCRRRERIELAVLAQRDPGGVVAPVLEALQAVEEKRLRLTRSDVSDDPAHAAAPSLSRAKTQRARLRNPAAPSRRGSAELVCY